MKEAPLPPRDRERVDALRAYSVLDTPPERAFDDITRLASLICGTPIALVSFIDEDRQWVKSRVGVDTVQIPRTLAFCAHAILGDEVMIVPDAGEDDRFADNPFVTGEPHVRFYAGAPLTTPDGERIGTLCVIDRKPRELTAAQRDALAALARRAVAELELRKRIARADHEIRRRDDAETLLRARLAESVPPDGRPERRVRIGVAAVTAATLLVALALTAYAWANARRSARRAVETRFERQAVEMRGRVVERLQLYAELLRGAEAFVRASGGIDAERWKTYVETVAVRERYPGIRAIAYAEYVPSADEEAYEASVRRELERDFAIWPKVRPGDRFVIRYIEPRNGNERAKGYDLASEEQRRRAAEAARLSGEPRMTGRISLVQDPENLPAVLLFVPVGSDADHPGPPSRWVFAAIRIPDFVRIIETDGELRHDLDVAIADGNDLLYAGAAPPAEEAGTLRSDIEVPAFGRLWRLTVTPRASFFREQRDAEPVIIAVVGSLASLLLAGVVWSLATTRARALALATSMTAALRSTEARTRAIVDSVDEAILAFGPGGIVQSANPAAERMFRMNAAELLASRIERLVPALADGLAAGQVTTATRPDGSTFPVEVSTGETTHEGRALSIAIVRDVTDRVAADRALRASEERMRAIVDNMLTGLLTIDREGRIVSSNAAAEAIFGYGPAELAGRPVDVLIAGNDPEVQTFMQAAPVALGHVIEWRGRRSNGEVFPFELALFDFETEEGRFYGAVIRDVTEREAVDRLKNEFVSTVSHELRTPLTSIRGSLGLLSAGALGELPPKAKQMVAVAERNSTRLMRLVNDILDFERLESGKLELNVEYVAARTIVGHALDAVRGFAEQHGVTIDAGPLEGMVLGDEPRLTQVVVNLLSNAVKFSERGSRVTVAATRIAGAVEFRVSDHGRGIPAESLERIFDRFQQVESSDARTKGGTGLGLAIAKAIIERHGGTIGVESTWGKGSSFWFQLAEAADELPDTAGAQAPREEPE